MNIESSAVHQHMYCYIWDAAVCNLTLPLMTGDKTGDRATVATRASKLFRHRLPSLPLLLPYTLSRCKLTPFSNDNGIELIHAVPQPGN